MKTTTLNISIRNQMQADLDKRFGKTMFSEQRQTVLDKYSLR